MTGKHTIEDSLKTFLAVVLMQAASLCGINLHAQGMEEEDTTFVINEIMVANNDQYIDNAYCYGAWVELYNPTSEDIALRNIYVTDGVTEHRMLTAMGSVPAGGYKVLYFDHYTTQGSFGTNARLQIPFKLNPEGGVISFLSSVKSVLATAEYPACIPRCSYARLTDGAKQWGWTSAPTLGASNNGTSYATQRLAAPVVDKESCLFRDAFNVKVTIPRGTSLRYTTDGSTPTATNGETSTNGSFSINRTTILRLCLVANGKLTSPVVTRSYIYTNHPYYLPVISIATAPKNFFDNTIGIFVKGTNGISGNGQSSACNWNMDWERPVNVEYLAPSQDGSGEYVPMLNIETDLEISGGWTRAYGGGTVDGKYWETRSSFRIKTDKRYEGVNEIACPVFPDKQYNKYRCWQVRNGGNDTKARIIDPALQQIVMKSGFYVDCQDYQPAHVFFNGQYFGMLNIRESNNKHYGYSNYGIDMDDMDQFDLSNSQYNQKIGDNKAWLDLVKLASQLSTQKTPELYEQICERLDIDEYINYMALECFIGPSDWLTNTNNVKGFRSRSDGKFHFVLFDLDSAFGSSSMLSSVMNLSGGANVDDLFRYLMKYDPFRRQFVDAFSLVDGSVFEPERCAEIVQSIYNNINYALSFEGNSSNTNLISTIRNAYNSSRIINMRSYMQLGSGMYVTLSSNLPEARLLLNGQEIPTGKFAGYMFSYKGEPVNITAKAPAGYRFAGWSVIDNSKQTSKLIENGSQWMYYDQGSMDGKDWTSASFDAQAAGWKSGKAPLGYANAGAYMQTNAATILDYGTNSQKKRPTYYFRKTFSLSSLPDDGDVITFRYLVDDGLAVYVNGHQVHTYYVDGGASYSDYTTGGHYEGTEPASGSFAIPHEYLVEGENIIAVQVKNTSASSTDIYFEGSLEVSTSGQTSLVTMDSVSVEMQETVDISQCFKVGTKHTLRAKFQPISGEMALWEAGASPIRINEVSAANDIHINDYGKKADWIELYNTTDRDIPLSGLYLSDKGSRPQKFQMQDGVVPAHGTCVIWCDGMGSQGQLHAPFKLDNADGSCVSIQAEDGSWADCLTYREQDRWQTFGRYPDGGNMATILNQPTIDKTNKLSSYGFDALTEDAWLGADRTIILALAEGWNWTSHNLAVGVDKSRLVANALCLRNQTSELLLDSEYGWQGSLQSLEPAHGYKVRMQRAADVVLRGPVYDTGVPVLVRKGWNWIGCPLFNATNLEAALANYSPEEGDRLVGLDAFATFEEGQWHGSLTSLQPGQSYLLYSGKEQEFCWQSLSPVTARTRRYAPARQAEDAAWQTDIHAYPNVMTLVAEVQTDGMADLDGRFYVAAFAGDECRGVGVMDDNLLYMNIHGEAAEDLTFCLLDAQGEVYKAQAKVTFQPQQQLGSLAQPYQLSFGDADILDEVRPAIATSTAPVLRTEYYNLSGQRVSFPASGVLIRRTIYQDGRVGNTKVML